MTSVKIIDEYKDFAAIRQPWTRLYESQRLPSPFLHWIWFDSFWAEMDLGGRRPLVLTAWEGDRLTGASPMLLGWGRFGGLRSQVATGLENVYSSRFNWIIADDPGQAEEAASGLLGALAGRLNARHVITWGNAPLLDTTTSVLARRLLKSGYRVVLKLSRSPSLVSFPDGDAALFSSFSANMRSRLRSGWNRLQRMGNITFAEVSRSAGLEAELHSAWDLELQSWKGRLGTAVALDPRVRRFYDRLVSVFAPLEKAALFMLRCDDALVAFLIAVIESGHIYGLKFSYNPDFARVSPGYLIIWKIIEWAASRGISRLDLGGGNAPYKSHWGGEQQEIGQVYAFPKRLDASYMYAMHLGWKQAAKRLPGVSILRNKRHRR